MSDSFSADDFAARVDAKRREAYEAAGNPLDEPAVEQGVTEVTITPGAAEEQPVEEAPVEETPTEEEATAAADAAEDALPDDATQEEIEAARAGAEEEFYAGRYKTREEADRGIAEQKATIDRLHMERAELRRQVEEAAAAKVQDEQQPVQIDEEQWREWAQTTVEAGAGEDGAIAALREGGYAGYQVYLRAWMASEDAEQRADATIFNNAVMLQVAETRAAATVPQPAEQSVDTDANRLARERILVRRPDFAEVEPLMDETLEAMTPEQRAWMAREARTGVEGRERVLDYLYLETVNRGGEGRVAAQVAEREQRRTSARRATVAATVASAEATATRTPLSEAERNAIGYMNERRKVWGLEPLPEE